jgi:hypothetical protein
MLNLVDNFLLNLARPESPPIYGLIGLAPMELPDFQVQLFFDINGITIDFLVSCPRCIYDLQPDLLPRDAFEPDDPRARRRGFPLVIFATPRNRRRRDHGLCKHPSFGVLYSSRNENHVPAEYAHSDHAGDSTSNPRYRYRRSVQQHFRGRKYGSRNAALRPFANEFATATRNARECKPSFWRCFEDFASFNDHQRCFSRDRDFHAFRKICRKSY